MGVIIGLVVVFALVFGGYVSAGGKFGVIAHALPHELMMIGGASLGAFIVANLKSTGFATLKSFGVAFKGPAYKKQDYLDMICLLFVLTKLMRTKGLISLEAHIEHPEQSAIFSKYPKLMKDHFAIDLICDTVRMMSMGVDNVHHIEDMIEKKIEKHHHEHAAPAHALQTVADGLPAIGIVAAVLGVIKTMSSITEPPEVLGAMIGGALVGTFLGVFLAYCMVGPLSSKLQATYDQDNSLYLIIRDVIIAHLNGSAPQISAEMGRGAVPGHLQPSFQEVEDATGELKIEA